jgi:nucleotide-binding universal stress UspA family protein
MENTVLVGVDGSSGSAGAAAWALAEAEARRWKIAFVHAVPPAGVADPEVEAGYFRGAVGEAERKFGPFLADAEARGVHAEGQVVAGRAPDVLIRLSSRAELVVVGRRHRTGYVSRFGSVSASVTAHASCWTAVVPETWDQDRPAADSAQVSGKGAFFGHVIVGVDEGPEAPTLIAVAAEMAERHGVPLSAVTVGRDGTAGSSVAWLSDLLLPIREKHPRLQCASFTLRGMPADKITEAAHGARLLVVGSRGLGGISGIVRGSVSQAILEDTGAPVLVVPSRRQPNKPG